MSAAATKEDLQQLLADFNRSQNDLKESFNRSLEARLEETKDELSAESKKQAEALQVKLKDKVELKWKREGNRRQFEFNQTIQDLIGAALADPLEAQDHLNKANRDGCWRRDRS